jgi:hypothetical protein
MDNHQIEQVRHRSCMVGFDVKVALRVFMRRHSNR